jgi:hypothetical protein
LDLVEIDNVVMYNLNIFDHYLYEFLLDGHDHLKSPEHMIVTFLREERGHGVDGESPPFSLWNGQRHRKVSMLFVPTVPLFKTL